MSRREAQAGFDDKLGELNDRRAEKECQAKGK